MDFNQSIVPGSGSVRGWVVIQLTASPGLGWLLVRQRDLSTRLQIPAPARSTVPRVTAHSSDDNLSLSTSAVR